MELFFINNGGYMDKSMIEAQSKSAYGQWCDQWRSQAKIHSKFKMKSFSDLENSGIGRAVLCVANGYSFEENIETIKKHKDNVDILCCDKSLGHLLNNGIKPKYVVICDANVNYEKYLSPYLDQLSETIALVNVCANPQWTENIKWKDIYFFVNKDIIDSYLQYNNASCIEIFYHHLDQRHNIYHHLSKNNHNRLVIFYHSQRNFCAPHYHF